MNLNLYVFQGKILVVDMGVTFEPLPGANVVVPDISLLEKHKKDIVGLVLTHAHEDHIGAIPYVWDQLGCPIYATPFTAAMIQAKLKGFQLNAPLKTVDALKPLWCNPFKISFLGLTHSIPEPKALAIETPLGIVMHTGDWKIDADPLVGSPLDEDVFKYWGGKGILALVCDSTSVFEKGHSKSEREVRLSLERVVARFPHSRIYVSCFASNVARMASCAAAARKHRRKISLAGRSLKKVEDIARRCGYAKDMPEFLPQELISTLPREKSLVVCTGSQGEPLAALAKLVLRKDKTLPLEEGDVVIFSSRIIPGNERAIFDLQNQLVRLGVHVITQKEEPLIHASGHPSQDELKKMYDWVKPHIAIPVHGEDRHLAAHGVLASQWGVPEIIVPRNGQCIRLAPSKAEVVSSFPVGRLVYDGHRLIPYEGASLDERRKLSVAGVVHVAILREMSGSVRQLALDFYGVAEHTETKDWENHLDSSIRMTVQGLSHTASPHEIKEVVRREIRRSIFAYIGKKPHIQVHVLAE